MERRNFLKVIIGGGLGVAGARIEARAESGHPAPSSCQRNRSVDASSCSVDYQKEDVRRVDLLSQPWWRTIFCQVAHAGMLGAISSLASRLRCSVQLGRPNTPDVIALPAFVVIVDRTIVGRSLWDAYLEYRTEIHDQTPCIIAESGLQAGYWPSDSDMFILSPDRPRNIARTLRIIASAHQAASESAR